MIHKYPTYGEIKYATMEEIKDWYYNLRKPLPKEYANVSSLYSIEQIKFRMISEIYEENEFYISEGEMTI